MGMTEEYFEMYAVLKKLKYHLWRDGCHYGISRLDEHGICMGEAVMFGDLFERANVVLEKVDRKVNHEIPER